jgi:hypothetical protein
MSVFAQAALRPDEVRDLSKIPPGLELFARVEGLIGEEAALLPVPHEERQQEHHERLSVVAEELDERVTFELRGRSRTTRQDANTAAREPARIRIGASVVRPQSVVVTAQGQDSAIGPERRATACRPTSSRSARRDI